MYVKETTVSIGKYEVQKTTGHTGDKEKLLKPNLLMKWLALAWTTLYYKTDISIFSLIS